MKKAAVFVSLLLAGLSGACSSKSSSTGTGGTTGGTGGAGGKSAPLGGTMERGQYLVDHRLVCS
jgi:hypothetical protein